MSSDDQGRPVAIITGGARGIGFATAQALAADGHDVVIADIDPGAAHDAVGLLASQGHEALAVQCDVGSSDSVDAMVGEVVSWSGRLDVLVNNAGIVAPTALAETSDEEWDRIVGMHLGGTFKCSRAAFPHLCRSPAPAVVNTASITMTVGVPLRASYSAAKAGIGGLTRVLAAEWAPYGIRVNAVAPGFVPTAQVQGVYSSLILDHERLAALVPLGRLAVPEDVGSGIAFLASRKAAYITGHVLVIDGGFTIGAGRLLPEPWA
jgi:NAD(P)-dependent dehydrogenase (short-subunit alcohol dehydrogenase family)